MKKDKKIRLFSFILTLIILFLLIGFIYMYLENQNFKKQLIKKNTNIISPNDKSETSDTNVLVNSLNNQLNEKNKIIEKLEKENTELKNNYSTTQILNENSTYKIGTIKNVYDVISDTDTNLVKAQKIAKEVMMAVNNKDWYYLAKMIGANSDNFIEYGIHNYTIDINDYYQPANDKYIFYETYDWDKNKLYSPHDVSLGGMLVITFEDGGRININPNCTGP